MSDWPEQAWRSVWLAGIDASGRDALQAAGRVCAYEPGAELFTPGQPADALFVLLGGAVDVVAARRGEARSVVVRRARAGDAVGEEAVVRSGSARVTAARCELRTDAVRIPSGVYRRVCGRLGEGRATIARERALACAAARDVLLSSSLTPALQPRQLEALSADLAHRRLARAEVLFAAGDPPTSGFVVADGMVSLEVEREGRLIILGYLQRGDVVVEVGVGREHAMTARACGIAWVVPLPTGLLTELERDHPGLLASTSRVASPAPAPRGTGHVGNDLWRYLVAGSMLVIDDEVCVRCGHCAWSCGQAHGDGVSRLVRRGEKLQVHDAQKGEARALIVAGSCQQCKHPACMIDCPTGAIGRGHNGEVVIRDEICVGCGQCERACPWGGVQMAPRPSAVTGQSAQVAVKCDLCSTREGGPACVEACPAEAIARVEPIAAMADVRAAVPQGVVRAGIPRPRAAWPWVVGVALPAVALASVGRRAVPTMATGAAAGGVLVLLLAYSLVKRLRLLPQLPARAHAIAHLSLGVLSVGVVLAHAGARLPANAAGGALIAFAAASLTGIVTGLAYATLPRLLARHESRARLHEDLKGRAREVEDRMFAALSGRSEATKAAYRRILSPYARAPLGGLWLVLSRRTLRGEEAALRTRIDALAQGRLRGRDELGDVIALVVELRALRVQRALHLVLRGCVPAHVVAVAVATVLIAVHVAAALGGR